MRAHCSTLLFMLLAAAPARAEQSAISGHVRFAGQPPPRSPIAVKVNPEVCGARAPITSESLVVGPDGALANAAVMLVGITERAPPRKDAVLEQKGCVFAPHVQTVTAGSTLVIGNDDPVVHNVHARLGADTLFNLGMPLRGTKVSRKLEQTGVAQLSCDSGHTWMQAYLVVVPHSYHATTGPDGSFRISGVSPGSYTLRAWHERLGVLDLQVKVEADKDAVVELSYPSPSEEAAPPALDFATQGEPRPDPAASLAPVTVLPDPEAALGARRAQRAADIVAGQALYRRHCAPCHGDRGDGRGEATRYLHHRPRDFTRGEYKLRSTPSGQLPRVEDLVRTIAVGIPGTEMPAWRRRLSAEERQVLARYVMSFSERFVLNPPGAPMEIPAETKRDPGSVTRGRELYQRLKCAQCHGPQGAADGVSRSMVDDFGQPISASDLTRGVYKSGPAGADLYRTLLTGLSGTPMPAFADLLDASELWDLVHYLQSLADSP